MTYKDRLELLDIDALELRRLKFDLCILFKIVKGLVCVDVQGVSKLCPNFKSVILSHF